MKFKVLQFPPDGSSRVVRMRAVPKHWSIPAGYSPDTGFFQSWLEKDPTPDGHDASSHNWGAIYGLAISVVVSASFWFGAVLLIQRLLK